MREHLAELILGFTTEGDRQRGHDSSFSPGFSLIASCDFPIKALDKRSLNSSVKKNSIKHLKNVKKLRPSVSEPKIILGTYNNNPLTNLGKKPQPEFAGAGKHDFGKGAFYCSRCGGALFRGFGWRPPGWIRAFLTLGRSDWRVVQR